MIGKALINKLVAALAAAGCVFVALVSLGAALFFALDLVMPALGAAAITFAVFAASAALISVVFLKGDGLHRYDDEEEESETLVQRATQLIRERPIMAGAAGLGALFFLLRNPALAAIVASMITEKRMESRGYGRRRR